MCGELASFFQRLFSKKVGLFATIGVYMIQLQFGGLLPDHRHLQCSILHSQRVSRRITGTECKEITPLL